MSQRNTIRQKECISYDLLVCYQYYDVPVVSSNGSLLFDADYPYIVPLHYGYEYTEGILIFYMHCAKEGHKLDLIRSNPNVCIEVESDVELISGGDVACKYGASFASVIGRGRAELTEDVQEKIRGLSLFMKNQTGREFNINEEMASTVEVIKVVISEFTAKSRSKA